MSDVCSWCSLKGNSCISTDTAFFPFWMLKKCLLTVTRLGVQFPKHVLFTRKELIVLRNIWILEKGNGACPVVAISLLDGRMSALFRSVPGTWLEWCCAHHALYYRRGLCQGHHSGPDGLVLPHGCDVHHRSWPLCCSNSWALLSWEIWHMGKKWLFRQGLWWWVLSQR